MTAKEKLRKIDKKAYNKTHLTDQEFADFLNGKLQELSHEEKADYEQDAAAYYRHIIYQNIDSIEL